MINHLHADLGYGGYYFWTPDPPRMLSVLHCWRGIAKVL